MSQSDDLAPDAEETLDVQDDLGPLSQFRHGAQDRRLLELARLDAGLAANLDFDDKPWGLLYRALIDSLYASPDDFQLIYPAQPWDWPRTQAGFIPGAQFDFCATAPQWSAIAAFVSSGDTMHQAYQQCLNVAQAQTEYPSLRRHLIDAEDELVAATNQYTLAATSAASVHANRGGEDAPSFSQWLGSRDGRPYQNRMVAAEVPMNQAQAHYAALVAQCDNAELGAAQRRCGDEAHRVRLADLDLLRMPKVPEWRIAEHAQTWTERARRGEGPAGVTLGFSNREAPYDFGQTWAGRQSKVRRLFWQLRIDDRWERIDEFEYDHQLELSLDFRAVDRIAIAPGDWYDGDFARSLIDGPFAHGYSAFGDERSQAVFGEKGFFGLVKRSMYVGYKPSFAIRTTTSTFRRFGYPFQAATGLRIGPFTFEAEGGSRAAGWRADAATRTFTGTTTSDVPMIFGVGIGELPNA